MKLNNCLAYLVSAFLISFIESAEKRITANEKNEFCPRTVKMRISSEKQLMKYGYRCASVNEDELAYQYYLKAIEAANYSGKVMRKVAKKLNQSGKQALSNKILNTARSEKEAQKGVKKATSSSTREIYSKLIEWAKKLNAKIGPIEIRELSEINRYFVSTRDILSGEVLVSLPEALCFTRMHPEVSTLFREIDNHKAFKSFTIRSREAVAMITYIMKSIKEGKGYFTTFFNSFPKTVDEYPDYRLLTNPQSLAFIKNSFIEESIQENIRTAISEFNAIKVVHPELKSFTLLEYVKAGILFNSRNFGVDAYGQHISLMAPIADLFNHDGKKANANWRFNSGSRSFEIFATNNIKKGEEVFLTYGGKDSSRYLTSYGFIPRNHSRDNEYTFNDTAVVLGKATSDNIKLYINTAGDAIFSDLQYYRRLYITPAQNQLNSSLPLSIENEKSSINAAINALSKRLSRYPTALQQDKIQINNNNLSYLQKNLLRILSDEKTAIMNSLKNLKLVLNVLNKYNPNRIHIIQRSLFSVRQDFVRYFDSLRNNLKLKIYYN